ncbi:esterase/lipase [Allocatelliglobosispora scoriae]|uniref:Esterase/lipase n=1 Tax=Allocatelliglobosispora scoriae TaxID=643052 RepID=A0A841BN46_9ACTN|nr:alpha/beta hydrolase [Allocatelliglobosispora scoriae]MBB5868240.1 esterase/lipase [Allocatelliglobosispora scoriae]
MAKRAGVLIGILMCWAVTACTADAPAGPAEVAGPDAGQACPEVAGGGLQVRFGAEIGDDLRGVELGSGTTGVVLVHEETGDVCEWLPFGVELMAKGYRVLAFDSVGNSTGVSTGSNKDLVRQVSSAAAFLRSEGAKRIVLIGASVGGTAVLAAGPVLTPAPAAVVAISPPGTFEGMDALAGAAKLTVPTLIIAAERDRIIFPDTPDTAKAAYEAVRSKAKKLIMLDSLERGHNLVTPGIGTEPVRTDVFAWLTANARA